MGVIQTLRNKGGKISVVVISIALLMFLVQDALSGRNSFFRNSGSENTVGTINGEKIDYKDLELRVNNEVENYVKRNPNATADDQIKDAFRDKVWQQMIQEKVMKPQFNELGIDVTGMEIYTMCTTDEFATEVIRKSFSDPKTNIFDPNTAKGFFKRLDDDQNGEAHAQWQPFEDEFTQQRFNEKYNAMAKAGVYVTALEVKNQMMDNDKKYSFQFVSQQYANFNDTTLKVTPDEVKAYFSKNKEKYKRDEEIRKVNYVYFDFVPSSEDSAEVRNWGNNIIVGFKAAASDSVFVLQNMGTYDNTAKGHGELDPKLEDSLYNAPIGKIVGPYEDGGSIKVAKLVNVKEDTITYYHASHILVKVNGPTAADTAAAFATATDYMNQIKSGKKTFDEMARMYGTDGTKDKGGDLGWFKPGAMVKDFEDAVKRTPNGQLTVAKTQFGVHVIKSTSAPSRKKIVVATLSRKIVASQKTTDGAYAQVAELASSSTNYTAFAEACKQRNIQMRTVDLSSTNKYLPGIQNPKSILSWAYRAEKGEVSQLYTIEDKYVLASVKEILSEGVMKQEEVADIEALALKDKKAKVLTDKFNENLKNAQTPEQLAISFSSAAQQINNATFGNTYLEYIGNEPEILANMVTLPKQKFSKPIQGANGVYVIYVNDIVEPAMPDANIIKAQQSNKNNEGKQRVEGSVTEALKTKYKVKDLRYRF